MQSSFSFSFYVWKLVTDFEVETPVNTPFISPPLSSKPFSNTKSTLQVHGKLVVLVVLNMRIDLTVLGGVSIVNSSSLPEVFSVLFVSEVPFDLESLLEYSCLSLMEAEIVAETEADAPIPGTMSPSTLASFVTDIPANASPSVTCSQAEDESVIMVDSPLSVVESWDFTLKWLVTFGSSLQIIL